MPPSETDDADIYYATRDTPDGTFSVPKKLPGLPDDEHEGGLSLGPDRLEGLFSKGAIFAGDIFIASRSSIAGDFENATKVSILNSDQSESDPFLSFDGSELFFTSNRDNGDWSLWRSQRELAGTFRAPTPVAEINTPGPHQDTVPALSADGLTLYFSSTRSDSFDIWRARRQVIGDPWQAPEAVDELNTSGWERPGWLSVDGCRIYFESDRDTGFGSHDIWFARRR